jgi:hypothetical protein
MWTDEQVAKLLQRQKDEYVSTSMLVGVNVFCWFAALLWYAVTGVPL